MQEVHIFLTTSSHAPRVKKAWYQYILVCQGKTLTKKIDVQNVTGHQLVMECAIAALKRMIRPAMLTIHSDCHYLANGHGKIAVWKSAGWKRENGQDLKNVELWQQLEELLQLHAVRFKVESMLPYSETGSI